MYTKSEVLELTGISPNTLKRYIDCGVIDPPMPDVDGADRFTIEDVGAVRFVRKLTQSGFNIDEAITKLQDAVENGTIDYADLPTRTPEIVTRGTSVLDDEEEVVEGEACELETIEGDEAHLSLLWQSVGVLARNVANLAHLGRVVPMNDTGIAGNCISSSRKVEKLANAVMKHSDAFMVYETDPEEFEKIIEDMENAEPDPVDDDEG